MQKTTTYLKATLLAITLVLGSAYVSAWTAPVSDPPGGSVALPVNTGNTDQIKTGGLGVGNLNSVGNIVSASGVIKPGSFDGTVTACGASGQPQAGSMRFNSTSKAIEYCDGAGWKSPSSSSSVVSGISPVVDPTNGLTIGFCSGSVPIYDAGAAGPGPVAAAGLLQGYGSVKKVGGKWYGSLLGGSFEYLNKSVMGGTWGSISCGTAYSNVDSNSSKVFVCPASGVFGVFLTTGSTWGGIACMGTLPE